MADLNVPLDSAVAPDYMHVAKHDDFCGDVDEGGTKPQNDAVALARGTVEEGGAEPNQEEARRPVARAQSLEVHSLRMPMRRKVAPCVWRSGHDDDDPYSAVETVVAVVVSLDKEYAGAAGDGGPHVRWGSGGAGGRSKLDMFNTFQDRGAAAGGGTADRPVLVKAAVRWTRTSSRPGAMSINAESDDEDDDA